MPRAGEQRKEGRAHVDCTPPAAATLIARSVSQKGGGQSLWDDDIIVTQDQIKRHWPKWAAAAGTGGDEEGIRRKRVWTGCGDRGGERGSAKESCGGLAGVDALQGGPRSLLVTRLAPLSDTFVICGQCGHRRDHVQKQGTADAGYEATMNEKKIFRKRITTAAPRSVTPAPRHQST